MKINSVGVTELFRSEQTQATQRSAASSEKSVQPVASVDRGDRVQFSDAGRALAAQIRANEASGTRAPLTPERISELRERVLSGAYNSLDVVEETARKMLKSGDL